MNVYKGKLLKKSSNRKSKLVLSTLVTPWLSNIAFHLRPIWLQTLVVIDSESRLTSFPSFCAPAAPPSEVAVLLDSNLSRRPFLGQVVDLDLLLCTEYDSEHAVLFLCHIFTQIPMTDRKIERSDDGRGFGWLQYIANSIENFVSHEKKVTRRGPKFTKHHNLVDSWTESVPTSRNWSQPAATAADSETPGVCARPFVFGRWFCPLNPRLPFGTAFGQAGSARTKTWTQTWTLPHDQRVVKVLYPPKSQHKLCVVWILFKSVTVSNLNLSQAK